MDDTRKMLNETFAFADQMNAEVRESERRRERIVTKQHDPADLIYKTHEPQSQVRQQSTMDAATQAQWEKWVQAHIQAALEETIDPIAQFVSEYVNEKLAKVREEIAALRADLIVQSTAQRNEIKSLKGQVHSRKQRNVA